MRPLVLCLCLLWLFGAGALAAEPVSASAAGLSADPETAPETGPGRASLSVVERRGRLVVALELPGPVPWRLRLLDSPRRVVVDLAGPEIAPSLPSAAGLPRVERLAAGIVRPGWSRLVIALTRPMAVARAGMSTEGAGARLILRLNDTDAAGFAAAVAASAGVPDNPLFPAAAVPPPRPPQPTPGAHERLTVVLDPGHGGLDPGAERAGVRESALMLTFATELRAALATAAPGLDIRLTRAADLFVSLEDRVAFARHAGADVFVSLHADALAAGEATGAAVYTLAAEATDAASARLAERHDRADLLAGADFSATEDAVALTLIDIARRETAPRSRHLAEALVAGLAAATGATYKTPHKQADFSVLKAPDIPSVLIELGFLSSPEDRARLVDPAWRAQAAAGVAAGLLRWAAEDAIWATRLRE